MPIPSTTQKVLLPAAPEDTTRWRATKLRRRLLEGAWQRDLQEHMAHHLEAARQAAWGPATQALNLFRSVVTQLAVMYEVVPTVRNPNLDETQAQYLMSMNLFSKHKQHQKNVIGLRESFIRVHWDSETHVSKSGVSLRLVTPDCLVVFASPQQPTVPLRIEEAVMRKDPTTKETIPTWDVWDILNPEAPFYRIESNDAHGKRADISSKWGVDSSSEAYRFRWEDGRPYLPWVRYSAEDTGKMWDTYGWNELVWATLDLGLLMTFYLHTSKNASWDQKFGLDVMLAGGKSTKNESTATRNAVGTDPSSILLFESRGDKPGSLSSFTTPADPKGQIEAIQIYARAVTDSLGLVGGESQMTQSQSGIAIQLRRDAVRRQQAGFEVQARVSDLELLQKVSSISNIFSPEGTPLLPVEGWSIAYPGIPMTREEILEMLEVRQREVDLGLASLADLYMDRHPGVTRQEAMAALREVAKEKRELAAT